MADATPGHKREFELVIDLEAERRAFVATLRAVGPSAPTLAAPWNAEDLAAHVAATEQQRGVPTYVGRRLVMRGIRLNDTFKPVMAVQLKRFRRHGFDRSLRRLDRPSPGLLARPEVLPVSVFEVYVHHEDVLRGNDLSRTQPVPELGPTIEWLLRYHRRLIGGAGLRVELDDGRTFGAGVAVVRGPAGEVVLWLAGRRAVADVRVDGDIPAGLAV